MNKYYVLSIDPDPKVIGVRDGGSQAVIQRSGFSDKNIYDKVLSFLGSYDSWLRENEEPSFAIELQCVRLKKSAKTTDFMQFGPALMNCPFLVSEKSRSLLNNYKISKHKFYPSVVQTNFCEQLKYQLFFCMSLDLKVIDFKNSIIYEGLQISNNTILEINSIQEYESIKKSTSKLIRFNKYVLNEFFDKNLDMFVLGSNVFVSECLRYELLKADLTGIEITPAFGDSSSRSQTLELWN